jgi:hypothetical protein
MICSEASNGDVHDRERSDRRTYRRPLGTDLRRASRYRGAEVTFKLTTLRRTDRSKHEKHQYGANEPPPRKCDSRAHSFLCVRICETLW